MIRFHNRRTRLVLVFIVLFAVLFGMTRSARAQEIMGGSVIPASVTFEHDAFLFGEDVVLDGSVLGDVLAIGRTVTINGEVDGSLIALAETVTVNGEVDGSIYTGGVTLDVGETASIGRSAYFAGARLVTQPNSQIERDLVSGSLGAQLSGNVGREVRATIGIFEIVDRVLKAFNIEPNFSNIRILPSREPELEAQDTATLEANIVPIGLAPPKGAEVLYPAGGLTYQLMAQDEEDPLDERTDQDTVSEWLLQRLRLLVQFLIVGALAAWLVPAKFYRWSGQLRTRPVASGLYGFVGLVTGFAGVIIAFFLVLAIGIGLAFITLRGLAVATWGLGFSSALLAFWIFMIFLLFVSKVIVSYLTGLLILERLAPRASQRWIWPLLLGLIIYVLLIGIPYLGLAIGFLVTIFGLGAVILALSQRDTLAWKAAGEEE